MNYPIEKIADLDSVKSRLRLMIDSKKVKAADKALIQTVASDLSYDLDLEHRNCPNCWLDMATELLSAIILSEKVRDGKEHYILREGTDVFFGEVRVNEATLTDDLAREIIGRGFDTAFFINIPD